MKIKKEMILVILLIALTLWALPFIAKTTSSQQEINETYLVNATVNVTNAAPQVLQVRIPTAINLNAYSNTTIQCNVTTYDYNNDSIKVNASLHLSSVSPIGAVDQNFRYWNTSCLNISTQNYEMNWTCNFSVNYFATNGTWYCNSSARDFQNATQTNTSLPETINPLLAIQMDEVLNYGEYSAGDITNTTTANITNAGNRNINITVEGYGAAAGDGYAMICEYGSTIPVSNEHYGTSDLPFSFMVPLSGSATQISAPFYVPQRTSETQDQINTTYWRLQIPVTAIGFCEGKIRFTAIDRGN